jgi:hypothetical protein
MGGVEAQVDLTPSEATLIAEPDEKAWHVSDAEVSRLADSMNKTGVGVLQGYVSADDLGPLQRLIEGAVAANAGEYTVFTGLDAMQKTALAQTIVVKLTQSDDFKSLMSRIYEKALGRPAVKGSIYQVLRCISGPSGERHNYYFHFDSYVVTALLPILIPTEGRRGHLVMLPNVRGVRPFYFFNLIDKILLENPIAQNFLKAALERGWFKFKRIEMVPGNLYLFWGYKTLHANEACDPQNIRATSLFHFGDPHAASLLRQKMGRA